MEEEYIYLMDKILFSEIFLLSKILHRLLEEEYIVNLLKI